MEGLQKGVQRWLVDISNWNPSSDDFSFALSLLPQHENASITRFVRMEDRKRALVSRLLQYSLVHDVMGIPFDEISIKRTSEGKPYLENDLLHWKCPNFNFNASHQGDYVAIASEPICIVGIDIVSQIIPEKETVPEFIQNFTTYFSSLEWDDIKHAISDDEMLGKFYRYWCLKEAFVKAKGTGVGYRLDHVEFHHTCWTNIWVKVDGKELKDWRFWLLELGRGHLASVARGHPKNATESYRRTLKQMDFDEDQYRLGLHLPTVNFLLRTVEELVGIAKKT